MAVLGTLEKVPIRLAWAGEATDFTPWLCLEENLSLLGKAIDIDLEVIERESSVGSYRLDILARHEGTGEVVVIENQFGPTDHNHLGQLLTYAAGVGADGSGARTIIWIAETFNEPHRSALDWLNKCTEPGIRFFGVELELWRIGNSLPAPKFNLVSKPNDWQKKLTQQTASTQPNDELYAEFWASFIERAKENGSMLRFPSPWGRQWLPITIGRTDFNVSLVVTKKDCTIRCELYMSGLRAKLAFRLIHKESSALKSLLGQDLIFDEIPKKIATRIYQQRTGDVKNRSTWPELQDWLRAKAESYSTTFATRVRNLNLDDTEPLDVVG